MTTGTFSFFYLLTHSLLLYLFPTHFSTCCRRHAVVKGVAVLVLPAKMRASCVKIRWLGVENTYWSKGLTAWELAWAHKAQAPLHEAQTIFNKETVLWRAENASFSNAAGATDGEAEGEEGELPAGGSVFEFEWALPKDLPRSFVDASHMLERFVRSLVTSAAAAAAAAAAVSFFYSLTHSLTHSLTRSQHLLLLTRSTHSHFSPCDNPTAM